MPSSIILLILPALKNFFRAIHDQRKNLEMLKSTKKKVKITYDHMNHSINLYLLYLLYVSG